MTKAKKKGGRPDPVPYDQFVKVWKAARSIIEVAEKFGIKANSASAIAKRLRDGGVPLKRFPRRVAQKIDAKKLNKLSR